MDGEKIISAYAIPGVRTENTANQDEITRAVCKWACVDFNIPMEKLLTKSRYRKVAEPRSVIMYILASHRIGTLATIGKLFSRDHTSVIHSRDKIKGFMEVYPAIKKRVNWIEMKSGL